MPLTERLPLEEGKDQTDDLLHLFVGIERDLAGRLEHVAAGQPQNQLAALRLGAAALEHAGLEDVDLRLAHGALQAEQQAIVVKTGIVDAVGIADQGVEERAHLQQLMPIPARARQARDLDAEHQADMAKANLGHQALEAGPVESRGGGTAEIVIDDHDLLGSPAELAGAIGQGILQAGRFPVVLDLTQGGLADIDDRLAVTMAGPDLVGECRSEDVGFRAHDPPPVWRPDAGG